MKIRLERESNEEVWIVSSFERGSKRRRSGSESMMDTPVPIPNTEVKHHNGEDSTKVRQ